MPRELDQRTLGLKGINVPAEIKLYKKYAPAITLETDFVDVMPGDWNTKYGDTVPQELLRGKLALNSLIEIRLKTGIMWHLLHCFLSLFDASCITYFVDDISIATGVSFSSKVEKGKA